MKLDTISRRFFGKKKSKSMREDVQVVEVPSDVKHLQPGTEGTLAGTEKSGKKRKKELVPDKGLEDELPMEERLTNLTIEAPAASSTIRGNNLAHLLSQVCHISYIHSLSYIISYHIPYINSSAVK